MQPYHILNLDEHFNTRTNLNGIINFILISNLILVLIFKSFLLIVTLVITCLKNYCKCIL